MNLSERVTEADSVIDAATVSHAYEECSALGRVWASRMIKALCVSHERLRKQLAESASREIKLLKLCFKARQQIPTDMATSEPLADFPSNPE